MIFVIIFLLSTEMDWYPWQYLMIQFGQENILVNSIDSFTEI